MSAVSTSFVAVSSVKVFNSVKWVWVKSSKRCMLKIASIFFSNFAALGFDSFTTRFLQAWMTFDSPNFLMKPF